MKYFFQNFCLEAECFKNEVFLKTLFQVPFPHSKTIFLQTGVFKPRFTTSFNTSGYLHVLFFTYLFIQKMNGSTHICKN